MTHCLEVNLRTSNHWHKGFLDLLFCQGSAISNFAVRGKQLMLARQSAITLHNLSLLANMVSGLSTYILRFGSGLVVICKKAGIVGNRGSLVFEIHTS